MYYTVTPEGRWSEHEGVPDLDALTAAVGGYVEAVGMTREGDDAILWLNEEGKLEGLPRNESATLIAHSFEAIQTADYIAGSAVFTGAPDENGDTTSLPESWVTYIRGREERVFEPV